LPLYTGEYPKTGKEFTPNFLAPLFSDLRGNLREPSCHEMIFALTPESRQA